MSGASSSSPAGAAFTVFTFFVAIIFVLAPFARAQNGTQPTTDPSEVRALNSIFNQWKIKANTQQWNTTGDPCSGAAVDDSSFDDVTFNPFIKCDCSFNNSSLCHITQLKVYALDAVGPIPEELWSLTFLFNLNLAQNFLTGSLSPSIGNLTKMQYLSLGINALSGELPKELGQLTELLSVSLVSNNFFGPLPPELGNLNKLEQLYIDSAGFSGEIPSTFANLQSMQTLWASDNEFTGKIPDFIGNWTNLNTLRLQGNSFEGPIPSTFANLTSLKDLRLSEISNVSSSLAFIKDMKSLIILILRNNNIADSIPLNIGDYQQLIQLDLSFNNINGQIPDSLFTMSSLSILFLGNNSLTGTLPQQKKTSLHVIDLSYNNLVGNLPSWVNQENLQLNLVGGGSNFNIKSLKKSVLPSGLNCLQQNFPCNRGKGIYYNFGINCGGPEMTPSNGILYERDNETLGPATYYVSSTERWAVSNVGSFSGNNNASYTLESALFQTSRLSASSLRYYGLGLENGAYTVNLEFAETASLTSSSWKSNGRRVFDIYIQGTLEDGRVVAIKQLSVTSHHGKSQFIAEIATISAVQHRHLVKLYGCCLEGDKRLLVYEYLENKSLDRALFDHSLKLDWATRFNICLGVARGLSYLHEESHIRIVHRDIKASNILLDSNLNPKISDFGLAKFYDDKKTHISTCVAGTFGYLAPEYAMSGHLTEKADVFAFGVVALEIVCGRPRSDLTLEQEKVYLLEWAWNLHERKREVELVDLTLSSEFKEEEVVRVVEIALLCTQTSPFARPPMSRVVAMLLGDVEVNQKMSRPGYFSDWRFSDVSSIVSDIAANVSGNNHYYSSSSLNTMEVDLDDKSPTNTTRPMLSQSKVL
ncbi:probable LRR receptor-like serine/threonine-protein kinase At1g56140 isoform X2 [Humulus lupulus]|uniref:probable LRR receptor-like serine/threonine-protein kinase At1g56140 isoform X2 n=1 Tax=Humulus lupulus TaxID=3486 RepID=UPI002B40C29F|nr:probable LRR receptor-like serine/threonine-protein kinase At1g56140 isoform X2 [Humulus lupulus]